MNTAPLALPPSLPHSGIARLDGIITRAISRYRMANPSVIQNYSGDASYKIHGVNTTGGVSIGIGHNASHFWCAIILPDSRCFIRVLSEDSDSLIPVLSDADVPSYIGHW
jgi:hypothetical protein